MVGGKLERLICAACLENGIATLLQYDPLEIAHEFFVFDE